MKNDELGINGPISWTPRIQIISKNQNLYPQQSQITLYTLQWDTLYNAKNYYWEAWNLEIVSVQDKQNLPVIYHIFWIYWYQSKFHSLLIDSL